MGTFKFKEIKLLDGISFTNVELFGWGGDVKQGEGGPETEKDVKELFTPLCERDMYVDFKSLETTKTLIFGVKTSDIIYYELI